VNAQAIHDLSSEYFNWLKSNIVVFEHETIQTISTPFLDPFNDGIEISMEIRNGTTILHDNGKTLDNLLDIGIQIDKSERRKNIIKNAISGCGVTFNNGRLEIIINSNNRAQRMHFLITAILRLNDLWMSATPRNIADFFQVVQEFFNEQDVLYTANKSITGKTVEHPIDFIIPLPKGKDRLIKLISKPSVQTAKLVSFTWMDLHDIQPSAERIVIVNDFIQDQNQDICDEEMKDTKAVSDNVMSILNGYSHKVYLWSKSLKDQDFPRQLKVS